jgi:hypothetical protein
VEKVLHRYPAGRLVISDGGTAALRDSAAERRARLLQGEVSYFDDEDRAASADA